MYKHGTYTQHNSNNYFLPSLFPFSSYRSPRLPGTVVPRSGTRCLSGVNTILLHRRAYQHEFLLSWGQVSLIPNYCNLVQVFGMAQWSHSTRNISTSISPSLKTPEPERYTLHMLHREHIRLPLPGKFSF